MSSPDSPSRPASDGASIRNAPLQGALQYRIGGRVSFLRRLLAALPASEVRGRDGTVRRPLASLDALPDGDPTRALLDAAATLGDILTFYQERIANEGFLRTATERRSILELGRALGYELPPGVVASGYLSFTIDGNPTSAGRSRIPAGTAARSLPAPEAQPQTFETSQEIEARAAWNELRPQLVEPPRLSAGQQVIYLAGTSLSVRPGGQLLFVWRGEDGAVRSCQAARARVVTVEREAQRTRIELAEALRFPPPLSAAGLESSQLGDPRPLPLTTERVSAEVARVRLRESELQALLQVRGWDEAAVLDCIARLRSRATSEVEVYALRQRLSCFGYNAPTREPAEQPHPDLVKSLAGPTGSLSGDQQAALSAQVTTWRARSPSTRTVWQDHDGAAWPDGSSLFLERAVSDVTAGGFAVISCGAAQAVYRIDRVRDTALAQYGLTGATTGLVLARIDGGVLRPDDFTVRQTIVEVQSERLDLAPMPIDAPLGFGGPDGGTQSIPLDTMIAGLRGGQLVWVSGEPIDAPGITEHEVVRLTDVVHARGYSTLQLEGKLRRAYARASVRICANVAPATHGETAPDEVLGSGDATLPYQSFRLKRRGLVFTPAAATGSPTSSLRITVGGVPWREVPSLHEAGPSDRVFIVRLDDDNLATVTFGDGSNGARLPSGQDNVVARYRTAEAAAGQLPAFSLTLLDRRPLGVRTVTNPLPTTGAVPPEEQEEGRGNVPVRARTLDRAVSVRDYQDAALALGSISKTTARALYADGVFSIHITVAPSDGGPLGAESPLLAQTRTALSSIGDPLLPVRVQGYRPVLFTIEARLFVAAGRASSEVLAAATAALLDAYSFARRDFGEPVAASDILRTLQAVDGVVAAQLRALCRSGEPASAAQLLMPQAAQVDPVSGVISPAELLILQPGGVVLEEMR